MTNKKCHQRNITSSTTISICINEDTCANQNLPEQQKSRSVKKTEGKREDEKGKSKVASEFVTCRMTVAQKQMTLAIVGKLDKLGADRKVTPSRLLRATVYALENGDISEKTMLKYIERYT